MELNKDNLERMVENMAKTGKKLAFTPTHVVVRITLSKAEQELEEEVNMLAKLSPFTRDFANPPMSLKTMRKEAFAADQVWVAQTGTALGPIVVGFIWVRPMKPKHMPFSTVYYMGVHPEYRRNNVARMLLRLALDSSKEGRIELVCEDGNEAAFDFYHNGCKGTPISFGTVGKDNRPYTRFAFVRGQKGL